MNDLKIFSNEEFGEINVVVINKKEYFEAIPIARALGYSNQRDAIIRLCKKEGVEFLDVGVKYAPLSIDNDMFLVDNSLDTIEIEGESLN
ncbi:MULTISPECIES: BRO family protein [Romboutsia]|uniref:BRO family, N-terminal domain n=1 Tax=Romboutsia hominis TaxID=1507512 RepID=A0A2P2BQU0_9FIRM|nr:MULTISPECIES: BRO family protein [Romboutsia]MDB8804788.1 BRO family protein [Romboutsia sp. 1001216sp1]MDB8808103.1 BRO family protein [Romboutsia sp. 1001216sp1]MDB8810434.1 BRO family protein [Romboutsia sp. 1001216sp1]MDB8816153.1 BRO family protein [Romboutsia sp. 1001216sp1]MDB8818893.1 BRO family protein [Romboutsia sp. 1001216sp1]